MGEDSQKPASAADNRSSPRLRLAPGHTVRFRHNGFAFDAVEIVDISAGGVCARLRLLQAEPLEKGGILNFLQIESPRITEAYLTGQVAWIIGKHLANIDGHVSVGISFKDIHPSLANRIDEFVKAKLAHLESEAICRGQNEPWLRDERPSR